MRRHGDPLAGRRPIAQGTDSERFWSYVIKTDGCWLWDAGRSGVGYGMFTISGKRAPVNAHKFAYEDLVGPVPKGKQLHHTCEVKHCVNVSHLVPLTPSEHRRAHR